MDSGRDEMKYFEMFDADTGEVVPVAFRNQPLWNLEYLAVTLLLHLGRVKTDLPFADGLGPALTAGRSYEIRVASGMQSASGGALAPVVIKRFTVGAADRERPRPETWMIGPPTTAGEALVVEFGEPLDRATAVDAFEVVDAAGTTIPGRFEMVDGERALRFFADAGWIVGTYALQRTGRIEDLAGNTPDRHL